MTADRKEPSRGRPSKYTKAIAARICAELADGKSLRTICAADDMPCKTTVFTWLQEHKEFLNQYARARDAQADALFDEMIDIADETSGDTYEDSNGNTRTDNEVVQRSRLRIETRKWIAGKLRPKVYGDSAGQGEPVVDIAKALLELAAKLPG